jgi:hypothetical protein
MNRKEKIDYVCEKLGLDSRGRPRLTKNAAAFLADSGSIDSLIALLGEARLEYNPNKRPNTPTETLTGKLNWKQIEGSYREQMVNYLKFWGLMLSTALPFTAYEAIADYCLSKSGKNLSEH